MDSLLKPLLPKKYMCWGKGPETEIKSELINLRVWSLNRNFTTKPSSNPSYMYLKFHIILTCSKCDGVVKKWDWDQKWGFFLNGRPWVRINLLWARLSLVVPGSWTWAINLKGPLYIHWSRSHWKLQKRIYRGIVRLVQCYIR